MVHVFWNSLLVSPVIFGAMLVVSATAIADSPHPSKAATIATLKAKPLKATEVMPALPASTAESENSVEVNGENSDASDSDDPMSQVNSVSQLNDVKPTDWAFQALQSLVERYGCIAGYPNGTYRGNRALTRYEFAAGLNACLNRVNELVTTATSDLVRKADIDTLQRLRQDFVAELATVKGQVDNLEAETAKLQAQQFSTTVRLRGEATFALTGIAAGQNANGQHIDRITTLGGRSRLNFVTSFTGKDLLITRLRARNLGSISGTSTLTPDGDLRYAGPTFTRPSNNAYGIDTFAYIFRPTKSTTVFVSGNAGEIDDTVGTLNPFVDGDGNYGSLSNFGTRNSIYYLVAGAGLAVRQEIGDRFVFGVGYQASAANDPSSGSGLFTGPGGTLAQLLVKPTKQFNIAFTYVNSYNTDLTAGSNRANLRSALLSNNRALFATVAGGPGGTPNSTSGQGAVPSGTAALPPGVQSLRGLSLPINSNSYGIESSLQVNPKFYINGWLGYTATRTLSSLGGRINRGDLNIFNYAIILAFPDFVKEGSVAGIVFGMEPRVTGVSRSLREQIGTDRNTSLHIEGFYQYRLTDHITVTPGIIWITSPNFDNRNADLVIGAIRTRFAF